MTAPLRKLDWAEHTTESHYRRVKDSEAMPVVGCYYCRAAFPSYFATCADPLCGHEATDHHPATGECAVEEQTRRAYVSGDGIHDSEFDRCRCGGLRTEEPYPRDRLGLMRKKL